MKRVSSFTVIVAFVCLALVGVALIPLLPVKLNPFPYAKVTLATSDALLICEYGRIKEKE